MDMKNLAPAIMTIILIMLVVGVGVLVMDKTSDAVKVSNAIVEENSSIVVGTFANAVNDELLTLDDCYDAVNDTILTVGSTCNISNAVLGVISTDEGAGVYLTLNYTYDADTAASTNLVSSRDAIGGIATDWAELIITILVLAMVLGMVILGFGAYTNRR